MFFKRFFKVSKVFSKFFKVFQGFSKYSRFFQGFSVFFKGFNAFLKGFQGFSRFFKDSAYPCAGKFPLTSMGGRAECLACEDPGARTPIGVSGNYY